MKKLIVSKICPICGENNNCMHDQSCWCMQVKFTDYILQQIPEDAKNKACICQKCFKRLSQQEKMLCSLTT